MIRGKCFWCFLSLSACLLMACGGDEYHYPSVKLEFLTAYAGADGSLQSIRTDEGKAYMVVEDAAKFSMKADSSARIVSNYEPMVAADGTSGVKLYAVRYAVSPVPLPAARFEDGIKTDPADVLSIWMGLDYLNIILNVKAQGGRHTFHFVENKVVSDADSKEVSLTLFHDANGDVGYTQRAYLSVPLRQYATGGVKKVTVHFSLCTGSGKIKTYDLDYVPIN